MSKLTEAEEYEKANREKYGSDVEFRVKMAYLDGKIVSMNNLADKLSGEKTDEEATVDDTTD